MIEYIKGKVASLSPTQAVIDCTGVGYGIQISLQTYTSLQGLEQAQLYIYESIREDAHQLYGFFQVKERSLFELLISVSGVGANTARMILSSFSADELGGIIASKDTKALSSVKGIGGKTAERIVLDLKDKVMKVSSFSSDLSFSSPAVNPSTQEAISALVMLGFSNAAAQKAVHTIAKELPNATVESLIKSSLKII